MVAEVGEGTKIIKSHISAWYEVELGKTQRLPLWNELTQENGFSQKMGEDAVFWIGSYPAYFSGPLSAFSLAPSPL